MKYKVVLTNPDTHPPDESAFQILRGCNAQLEARTCTSHHELIELCKDADVVLTARQAIDSETIRTLKRCRLIVRIGTGHDNIDVKAAGAAGIPVSNVPQFCTDEVADHTMALLMACARKLVVGDSMLRKGTWNPMFLMPAHRLGGHPDTQARHGLFASQGWRILVA